MMHQPLKKCILLASSPPAGFHILQRNILSNQSFCKLWVQLSSEKTMKNDKKVNGVKGGDAASDSKRWIAIMLLFTLVSAPNQGSSYSKGGVLVKKYSKYAL